MVTNMPLRWRDLAVLVGICRPASVRGNQRGFTLLELVVVICLVAVLFTVAVNRLWQLQVAAEQAALDTMLGNLRSALGMKVAMLVVKGDTNGLRALQGSNPMTLMAQTPDSYLGERTAADPASITRGSWYFHTGSKMLVYRVRNEGNFQGGASGAHQARFVVQVMYQDRNRNGRFDSGQDFIYGVRLTAVEPYRWKEPQGLIF